MIEGGCLCGEVRYRTAAAPLLTAVCHCRNCRRQSGSAYSLITGFPSEGFELRGETRAFEDVGESGKRVERRFCPACGSPLVSLLDAMPGVTFVKAGTLDDPGAEAPTLEVYCDGALAFLPAFAGTARYPRSNLEAEG